MSENLGPINYSGEEEVFLGRDFSTRRNYSEEIASKIDKEVRLIIEEAYQTAEKLLTENIDKLHRVANKLLEVETLNAEEFEAVFSGEEQPAPSDKQEVVPQTDSNHELPDSGASNSNGENHEEDSNQQ